MPTGWPKDCAIWGMILQKAPHICQYAPWLSGLRPPADADATLANSWSAIAFARPAPLVTVVHHVVHDPSQNGHKTIPQRAFHAAFIRPMERAALRASKKVIAVSESTAKMIDAFLDPAPVDVVLNGVDTEFFCPADHRDPSDAARSVNLLYVGKLSRRKGFDLVAEIVAELGARAHLSIIGDGLEPGLTMPAATRLGRVDRSALRDAYQQADFLIFPSRLEGFGYVAAEAMACGLPVLCIEGGAVAEIVRPPAAGIAVPAERATELGVMAMALFSDRPRYDEMRRAARRHAVEYLSEKRWLQETEAVLLSAAGLPPAQ